MKITILIPCYNEENRLPETLDQIKEYIKNKKEDFEIIVIDDGSSDNTVKLVEEFDLEIKILENKKNRGKGYSIKRGMLESSGDFTLFMDADSSTRIKELDKFIPFFKDYDILIGSRAVKDGRVAVAQGFFRRNVGYLAHKLIYIILRTSVKDTMCGFKAYSRKARNILFKKQRNYGWGFDYEILYLAEKFNIKKREVPITWRDDANSKVTVSGYLKALQELFLIRLYDILGKYN